MVLNLVPPGKAASIFEIPAELSNSWGMGAITGFPLAFGLKLLLENKINKKGVFAPEGGAINPDDFFSLLTDHPLSVSRSWEI